jgi:hypothetical protein
MLPRLAELDEDGWRELERIVDQALAQRPRRMQRQFRLFLRLLDLSTLPTYRKRFYRLDDASRLRVLERMAGGPRLGLRRGVWGVRTLLFMGYYGQPARAAAIGYRASARGWSAREDVPAAASAPARRSGKHRGSG